MQDHYDQEFDRDDFYDDDRYQLYLDVVKKINEME